MTTATLILGDSYKLPWNVQALVFDPPYGIDYKVNARGLRGNLKGTKQTRTVAKLAIKGDEALFDPTPWLRQYTAIFGAHHFADRLPNGRWIVWDKRKDSAPDDHSDGDLIWLTGKSAQALRIHRQKWRGVVREGEENASRSVKLHPNQKPVALIASLFDALKLPPGCLVGDPFMGSGSTGVVALRRGHPFIGCESDPEHFETAYKRLCAEFGADSVFAI